MTIKILLLEDDKADRLIIKRILSKSKTSFVLFEAASLEEARNILKQEKITCCLLDRLVPDGCGLDLLEEASIKAIPCIMLTGLADETLAIEAVKQGVQDYLIKDNLSADLLLKSILYSIERYKITQELSRAKKQLEDLVRLDPLTGVLNRRGLEEIINRLKGRQETHGIILIDIDDFKQINDNYGYTIGDVALNFIANKLRIISRPLDHVARIGGDEFVMLVQNIDIDQCELVAERIRLSLEESLLNVEKYDINITASIGFSTLDNIESIQNLLNHTQKAVKRSKKEGKNKICRYPPKTA